VRRPAERRTPVEAIAAPDRMVTAMVLRFPAGCLAAGGPLPLHPPATDLLGPGRILQVEDHDDGADIALLLRGNVGVAAIKGETVHTHPGTLPMANVARIARSADIEDAQPDEITGRLLAPRPLAVHHHDVIRHAYLVR